MKYLFLILVLANILFTACKKDPDPSIIPIPDHKLYEERFKIISSHYWRLEASWQDTSVYGKAHPEEIPLSTSVNINTFIDSCKYYTCTKFAASKWVYTVKPYGCGGCGTTPSCDFFENLRWDLSKDGLIFNDPAADMNILECNDSIFKVYSYQIYNFTHKLLFMNVFKAHVYK
jgi:hypothetical protein